MGCSRPRLTEFPTLRNDDEQALLGPRRVEEPLPRLEGDRDVVGALEGRRRYRHPLPVELLHGEAARLRLVVDEEGVATGFEGRDLLPLTRQREIPVAEDDRVE